jgi:hypothetical protein
MVVARGASMHTQTPAPDYVALIIEWDEEPATMVSEQKKMAVPHALIQVASAALAGLGAIALAAWGIHRHLNATPAPAM